MAIGHAPALLASRPRGDFREVAIDLKQLQKSQNKLHFSEFVAYNIVTRVCRARDEASQFRDLIYAF